MAVVMCEGGYRNVKAVYMRKTKTADMIAEAGLPDTDWTLFDPEGRKCICAFERNKLFFWVAEHGIELVTVH